MNEAVHQQRLEHVKNCFHTVLAYDENYVQISIIESGLPCSFYDGSLQ